MTDTQYERELDSVRRRAKDLDPAHGEKVAEMAAYILELQRRVREQALDTKLAEAARLIEEMQAKAAGQVCIGDLLDNWYAVQSAEWVHGA